MGLRPARLGGVEVERGREEQQERGFDGFFPRRAGAKIYACSGLVYYAVFVCLNSSRLVFLCFSSKSRVVFVRFSVFGRWCVYAMPPLMG